MTALSDAQFATILDHVEKKCRGIGCGFARRECREKAVGDKIDEMMRNGDFGPGFSRHAAIQAFDDVLPDYFRTRYRHKRTEGTLAAFREQIFSRLRRAIS